MSGLWPQEFYPPSPLTPRPTCHDMATGAPPPLPLPIQPITIMATRAPNPLPLPRLHLS